MYQCARPTYVNNECLVAIKMMHSKWTEFQDCKTVQNYDQYKIARNKTIAELRKAKYLHEKDHAVNTKTNSKLFWGYVRSKLKTKSAIGQLQVQDGTVFDDNHEKADLLKSYFASFWANSKFWRQNFWAWTKHCYNNFWQDLKTLTDSNPPNLRDQITYIP